ncbi:VOC family protein [Vitiosangium sp. GDMCC 1.1324]|uniref:VOC family protein n=1 Tax=Vitiosangium sp. (strain GDMCC 1.1324) TaxID=2138576 RepID=UPI000D374461|nr:hypothetical protein DAT35_09240 [Vitiosangium sp. GDMCC 1.1324]
MRLEQLQELLRRARGVAHRVDARLPPARCLSFRQLRAHGRDSSEESGHRDARWEGRDAFFLKAEELKKKGVEFTQPPTKAPWGSSTMFRDPDGNLILLGTE